ncbi:MAG: MFS transporter [Neisseria sp.]|nr:MFS transporter [Neisseria sp.]
MLNAVSAPVSPRDEFLPQREPTLSLMLVVALIGVSAFINVYSVQSILPLLIEDFQVSAVAAGATVGVTVLAIAMISPLIGMLSDAIGRRGLIAFSVFFLSVPTGLIYFADSIETISVYRFMQGLVVPGIAVVVMAYISEEYYGKAMAKLMSAYIAGTVLGGFLGRFVVGHLSDFFGWREAYLIMAAMNLCASVLVFAKLPKSQYFVADRNIRHAFSVLGSHLRNRQIVAACCVGACLLFSLVGCFTYINLYLAQEPFSLTPAGLANIFAVYLIGVVVTPVSGRVIGRFGSRRTVVAALIFSSCGLLLTQLSSLQGIIMALAIASTGIFITQSAAVSFAASNAREGRSLAAGLYNMSYYFGGFVGAWVCGYAYMYGAWRGTVAVLVLVQMIAMGIAWKFMCPSGEQ